MKIYVPTFEAYVQSMLLLESPDSLMIAYGDKPKLEFAAGKDGYKNAFPFFVITDPSNMKTVLISDNPGIHGDFVARLRSEGTTGALTADDAGRIFIFDKPDRSGGFAVLTFYSEKEHSQSMEIATGAGIYLFVKKGPLEDSTIKAVANDFKDTHPNYSIYLEDPESKEIKPIEGSQEFGDEEYSLASKMFDIEKQKRDKLLRDIEMGRSDVYDKPKSTYYAKQSSGGMRDA